MAISFAAHFHLDYRCRAILHTTLGCSWTPWVSPPGTPRSVHTALEPLHKLPAFPVWVYTQVQKFVPGLHPSLQSHASFPAAQPRGHRALPNDKPCTSITLMSQHRQAAFFFRTGANALKTLKTCSQLPDSDAHQYTGLQGSPPTTPCWCCHHQLWAALDPRHTPHSSWQKHNAICA